VSMDAPPGFMAGGSVDDWAQNNIDVVYVINVLSGNYGTADGHIDKRGIRDWTWDTKGFSAIGDNIDYGAFTLTYKEATDNYVNDSPYLEDEALGVGQRVRADELDHLLEPDLLLQQLHYLNTVGKPFGADLSLPPDHHLIEVLGVAVEPGDSRIVAGVGQLAIQGVRVLCK